MRKGQLCHTEHLHLVSLPLTSLPSENIPDETGIRININAPLDEGEIYMADEFTDVLKPHQVYHHLQCLHSVASCCSSLGCRLVE